MGGGKISPPMPHVWSFLGRPKWTRTRNPAESLPNDDELDRSRPREDIQAGALDPRICGVALRGSGSWHLSRRSQVLSSDQGDNPLQRLRPGWRATRIPSLLLLSLPISCGLPPRWELEVEAEDPAICGFGGFLPTVSRTHGSFDASLWSSSSNLDCDSHEPSSGSFDRS